jgi:crotonobetainyl-CoA:carnitine CoA-transferase CaiB-like acyl-CoA transferase
VTEQALSDLCVLDLSEGVSGGYCTRLLAGLGAEVVKVEPPGRGDALRSMGPFLHDAPHAETGALHLHLNAGKRSITLDLESGSGRRLLRRLLPDADVLVESFSPGYLAELGLAYEALARLNPRLVLTSITPFGQEGPYARYRGPEIIVYALGGYMMLTGDPDREPLKAYGHQGEYQAGLQAAVGTLTALVARDGGFGQGQQVDVAATEAVAFLLGGPPQAYHFLREEWRRNGTRLVGFGPNYLYPSTIRPCRDGHVHAHSNNRYPELLAALLDEPRLCEPEVLASLMGHADEIDAIVDRWLASRDKWQAVEEAQALRLPFTEVLDPGEVMEDRLGQHRARDFFQEVDHPAAGRLRQAGAPVRMSETPWRVARAPLLGEHNEEVYCDRLGLSRADLVRLRRAGVI